MALGARKPGVAALSSSKEDEGIARRMQAAEAAEKERVPVHNVPLPKRTKSLGKIKFSLKTR